MVSLILFALYLTSEKILQHAGPLIFFQVFGRRLLVLHSYEAVVELMERRSLIYCDRSGSEMQRLYVVTSSFMANT